MSRMITIELLMVIIVSLLFLKNSLAEELDLEISEVESNPQKVLETMEKSTKIKDPFNLRDPFKEPHFGVKENVDYSLGGFKDGVFTNLATIENVPLSEITITGVLIGKERRAMAALRNGETILLKEGMKIGTEKSEIKAIMPGGLILVEKITNVYGQVEYLETVVPITENKGAQSPSSGGSKGKKVR